jgi:glycosyltransferase involved in cell wall biosynthesis
MQANSPIFVNGRVLQVHANGQKRVAEELIRRMPQLTIASPVPEASSGIRGHLWEQISLPLKTRSVPLWSPSTSGPVLARNHVVTVHDIAFFDCPQFFSWKFAAWYRCMVRLLVHRARHVVTVSEFTRQRLLDVLHLQPEKVTTIYSGASEGFQRVTTEQARLALQRLGVPAGDYLVGFAGNDPRKNTVGLMRAWKLVRRQRPDAHLVLFGRAANFSVFANAQIELNAEGVLAVGAVTDADLSALYSAAKGFVFPSYYEGFGLPVIEAGQCGCRVATSKNSALPEVAASDAILVDPSQDSSIAEGVLTLLTAEDGIAQQLKRIEESRRFSWDEAALRYTALFERLFAD